MLLSLTAQDLLETQVTALIGSLWSHGGVWTQTLWPFKSRSGRLHLIHRDTRPDTHTQTLRPTYLLRTWVVNSHYTKATQLGCNSRRKCPTGPHLFSLSVRACAYACFCPREMFLFYIIRLFLTHAHAHTHANGNLIQRYCCPVQGHLPTRPVSLTGR